MESGGPLKRMLRFFYSKKVIVDIHDWVNYAAEHSEVVLEKELKTITLKLKINTEICAVMDYFEIFTVRMLLCGEAAEFSGLQFKLDINGVYLL